MSFSATINDDGASRDVSDNTSDDIASNDDVCKKDDTDNVFFLCFIGY